MKIKVTLFFYILEGRKYFSGFKPRIKFVDNARNEAYACQMIFIDRNIINSGETIQSHLIFARPEFVSKYMKKGEKFNFFEGDECRGEGEIIALDNTVIN